MDNIQKVCEETRVAVLEKYRDSIPRKAFCEAINRIERELLQAEQDQ